MDASPVVISSNKSTIHFDGTLREEVYRQFGGRLTSSVTPLKLLPYIGTVTYVVFYPKHPQTLEDTIGKIFKAGNLTKRKIPQWTSLSDSQKWIRYPLNGAGLSIYLNFAQLTTRTDGLPERCHEIKAATSINHCSICERVTARAWAVPCRGTCRNWFQRDVLELRRWFQRCMLPWTVKVDGLQLAPDTIFNRLDSMAVLHCSCVRDLWVLPSLLTRVSQAAIGLSCEAVDSTTTSQWCVQRSWPMLWDLQM